MNASVRNRRKTGVLKIVLDCNINSKYLVENICIVFIVHVIRIV